MGKIVEFLESMGISIWLAIAGFFGVFLSIKDKEGLSRRDKVFSFVAGMLIANYITPLLLDILSINIGARYGIGFLLGYSGLEGIRLLISHFKRKIKKNE